MGSLGVHRREAERTPALKAAVATGGDLGPGLGLGNVETESVAAATCVVAASAGAIAEVTAEIDAGVGAAVAAGVQAATGTTAAEVAKRVPCLFLGLRWAVQALVAVLLFPVHQRGTLLLRWVRRRQ